MPIVNIQLKNGELIHTQASTAKVEDYNLILRDQQRDEIGRFDIGKVESWWMEPDAKESES